jgi:hypothetical protein
MFWKVLLPPSSGLKWSLKMEAATPSKTLVSTYKTMCCQKPEGHNVNNHQCETAHLVIARKVCGVINGK